jgi:2-phospho-L-lactate guanylyltransferase
VAAALESPLVGQVLVVTDDHELARGLADLGAAVIPDATTDDLNASLQQAASELLRRDPILRLAAVCADLPALRPDEVTRMLAAAPDDRMSFVADAEQVGTTAVLAPDLDRFRPAYGPDSRKAHLAAGAVELELSDVPGLQRDVDTEADLETAMRIGVGSRTSLVATGLR